MSEIQKKSVRFDHLEPTYTTYSNTTGSKTYDLEELLKRIVKAVSYTHLTLPTT